MTNKNSFGENIPLLKEIVRDIPARQYILETLTMVLENLGAVNPSETAKKIWCLAETETKLSTYEQAANAFLKKRGVLPEQVQAALCGRTELVYRQIKPYINGPNILDIGCGDGNIGARLSQDGFEVTLADVYKHPNIDTLKLPFVQFSQDNAIPTREKYNTTLLLTVLHHSDDPLKTLDDAIKRTRNGGNLVVIESVYGVDKGARDPTWSTLSRQRTNQFRDLSKEQQLKANIFFDHFYNRIIHYSENEKQKVNIPFNFRQPLRLIEPKELLEEGWENIFYEKGLKSVHFEYLGIDQPVVPEYHTLHILKKLK